MKSYLTSLVINSCKLKQYDSLAHPVVKYLRLNVGVGEETRAGLFFLPGLG